MKSIESLQANKSSKMNKSIKENSAKSKSQLATIVFAFLMLLGFVSSVLVARPAFATNPPEPRPTTPPATSTPVVNIPINVIPTSDANSSSHSTSGATSVIKTDIDNNLHNSIRNSTTSGPANTTSGPANTTSGPANTTSGPASTTSGPAITKSGNSITTGGDASVRGGNADVTGGNSSSASGAATTAAGNVTSVLRTGDNSFLYLPSPVVHPDVNITAGVYSYRGRVYIVCPTESSAWHITAYVLGGGASRTSDKMPSACAGLIANAQRFDAVDGLLSLLQYLDRDLQSAYASTAADRMLQIIGAQPVRRPAGDTAERSSSRHTEATTTRIERVYIREGAKVPGSN